jgi:anti-anti-sigma factor
MEIELTEEYQGNVLIVKIIGRLDAISAPQVDKKVSGLIDMGNKFILMDFSGVDYLSSAGMRLLLSATKRLKGQDGKFIISSINDDVLEVLKMAGFDRILSIANTREAALIDFPTSA